MGLDVTVLRDSFERAKHENGGTTALGMSFYARLFEKYPGVRPLFHTPPEEQHKKLMASLATIVAAVQKPEELLPFLHAMGIRHIAYGTLNEHYPAVAENLLAVLKAHLSVEGEWTDAMQETWEAALNTVAEIMIAAADHPDQYADEIQQAGYLPDGFREKGPLSREALRPSA